MKKLFKKIELNDSKSIKKLTTQLSGTRLAFSILWKGKFSISLYKLHLKRNNSWTNLIENVIVDSDEELTVEIGNFAKDEKIDLAFGVMAFENIDRSAIFIVEDNKRVYKMKPEEPDTYQPLEKFKKWEEAFQFTVGRDI